MTSPKLRHIDILEILLRQLICKTANWPNHANLDHQMITKTQKIEKYPIILQK